MGDSGGQYKKLPAGWDCKYDQATGNCYYVNYFTKAMQLEDPRIRYKPLQNEKCSTESIAMAPLNGSPYHVYPTNNYPAIRAFQGPSNNLSTQNMSASPLLSSRSNLEMSPLPLSKTSVPQTPHRPANMSRRSTIQETSFTTAIDTDAVVTKIQNIFPTAGENHIRLLLKRYMKTIFPKADETLLLDILANADNNIQKASEQLISMGYVKRDVVPPKYTRPEFDAEGRPKKPNDVQFIPLRPKEYTEEEKEQMKKRLKEKYNKIAERIILMALESVSYAEDRAMQILQIVQDEENETVECKGNELSQNDAHKVGDTVTDGVANNSAACPDKYSGRDSVEEDSNALQQQKFKSLLGRLPTVGHNTELVKGPDDSILLADYVTWNGANPTISVGHKQIATGADASLLSERNYAAVGRNADLCKGPSIGLAKGSIYAQISVGTTKTSNIKCN